MFLLDSTRVRPGFHKNIRTVPTFGRIVAKPWQNRIQIHFLVPGICQKLVESDLLAVFLLLFPYLIILQNAMHQKTCLTCLQLVSSMNLKFHGILGTWKPCFVYLLRYFLLRMTYRTDRPAKTKTNRHSCLPCYASMLTTGTGGGHNVHLPALSSLF